MKLRSVKKQKKKEKSHGDERASWKEEIGVESLSSVSIK